jgi:hypothetical protein
MIFKNNLAEKFGKKLTQNKAKLCNLIITCPFFAEKCQKSQKIVIITSTPGEFFLLALKIDFLLSRI